MVKALDLVQKQHDGLDGQSPEGSTHLCWVLFSAQLFLQAPVIIAALQGIVSVLSMSPDGYAGASFYGIAYLVMQFTCFLVIVQVAQEGQPGRKPNMDDGYLVKVGGRRYSSLDRGTGSDYGCEATGRGLSSL